MIPLANVLQPLEDAAEAIIRFVHDDAGFSWGMSIIALTFIVQKHLIAGLTFGGVKG